MYYPYQCRECFVNPLTRSEAEQHASKEEEKEEVNRDGDRRRIVKCAAVCFHGRRALPFVELIYYAATGTLDESMLLMHMRPCMRKMMIHSFSCCIKAYF